MFAKTSPCHQCIPERLKLAITRKRICATTLSVGFLTKSARIGAHSLVLSRFRPSLPHFEFIKIYET